MNNIIYNLITSIFIIISISFLFILKIIIKLFERIMKYIKFIKNGIR